MESASAHIKSWLLQHKARHIVLAVGVFLLIVFFVLREVRAVADFATTYIAHPWHALVGTLFGLLPFSVAEWLVVGAVLAAIVFLVFTIIQLVRKPEKLKRAYLAFISLLGAAALIYALLCWLWGIAYYSAPLSELSGIEAERVSVEELKEVTLYFAEAANEASGQTQRDENGVFTCDLSRILTESSALYDELPVEFEFLEGSHLNAKALVFSELLSHMNFTGFFFPYTGEANVNVHSPQCYIPSTVAHELAHQRGINQEQDANIIAIMVCMESKDDDFRYSGALLAYLHLSNALYRASYDDWVEVRATLNDAVLNDLAANNEYWSRYKTPVAEASEAVYTEFLHNQGQELGMRSYGACVDMLVTYYSGS